MEQKSEYKRIVFAGGYSLQISLQVDGNKINIFYNQKSMGGSLDFKLEGKLFQRIQVIF